MVFLKGFEKLIERAEEVFCAAAILLTTVVLFVNVVLRYVFSDSTSWAEELIRYLMIWITFIGGGICVRRGAHIRMDFIMTVIPRRYGLMLTRTAYLLAAAFCAALVWYGIRLMAFTVSHVQTSPALGVPMWVPYAAMPIGSALMALHLIQASLGVSAGEDARHSGKEAEAE